MRYILIFTFFVSTTLLANYAYKGENGGKIDMHGGKKQNFVEKNQNLSNQNFMLGNMGLLKKSKDNNSSK